MIDRMLKSLLGRGDAQDQTESEALLLLATFFYKVDKRVTLDEQDYIDRLMRDLPWTSPIGPEAMKSRLLPRVEAVLQAGVAAYLPFLAEVMECLTSGDAVAQAQAVAKEITSVDGEIDDHEMMCLDYVMNW